jgi:hypothetical protein
VSVVELDLCGGVDDLSERTATIVILGADTAEVIRISQQAGLESTASVASFTSRQGARREARLEEAPSGDAPLSQEQIV